MSEENCSSNEYILDKTDQEIYQNEPPGLVYESTDQNLENQNIGPVFYSGAIEEANFSRSQRTRTRSRRTGGGLCE